MVTGSLMVEPKCFNCSNVMLFPDGALRCELTNLLAIDTCAQYNFGKPRVYKVKLEKSGAVRQKKEKPIKAVKPIKSREKKPSLQARLM